MGVMTFSVKNPQGEKQQLTPLEYRLLEELEKREKVKLEGIACKFKLDTKTVLDAYMRLSEKGFCYVRTKHGRLLKNTIRRQE